MRRELSVCALLSIASLMTAAVCHRFYPGFGQVLKPLLWPLVVLPFAVRPRLAFGTAFAVPLLSAAVNGMPSWFVALSLSSLSAVVAAALAAATSLARRAVRAEKGS